jgi:hypothetical protein
MPLTPKRNVLANTHDYDLLLLRCNDHFFMARISDPGKVSVQEPLDKVAWRAFLRSGKCSLLVFDSSPNRNKCPWKWEGTTFPVVENALSCLPYFASKTYDISRETYRCETFSETHPKMLACGILSLQGRDCPPHDEIP